jgi:DNA uptake protein ComE-like DNA-binding protein
MELLTLKIDDGQGDYFIINEVDFDSSIHRLYEVSSHSSKVSVITDDNVLINLNTATLEQLTTLPFIGESRGNVIIDNRSYESIDGAIATLPDLPWSLIQALVEV